MATQQGLGLQPGPTQTLAHQAQQRGIRLPQQITDLPGALLLRLLQHQLILKVGQGRQHTVSIPIRIDASLPIQVGAQLITLMNLAAGSADPHLRGGRCNSA